MNKTLSGLVVAVLLALACHGCTVSRPTIKESDYPGELRHPSSLGTEVLWQQKLTARWGEGQERSFDSVLQVRSGKQIVLGLSPMGAVGFSIQWDGTSVSFRNDSGMEMPFPPRFVLLDTHRVYMDWLGGAAPANGSRHGVVGEEMISEEWKDGRLQMRRFVRQDNNPAGAIVVRYVWSDSYAKAPARAELDNGWFGYRMIIETAGEQLLSSGASAR